MGAQWKAKHKDLAANAKGRLFGKLAKEIMIAARSGVDPASNARLRLVVEQARKVSMPSSLAISMPRTSSRRSSSSVRCSPAVGAATDDVRRAYTVW